MDRVSSFRKIVCGDGSSGSSHSDTWYDVFSNRFAGLLAAPRPRFSVLTSVFSHGFVDIIPTMTYAAASEYLADLGRDFHRRGWALGTSGNFSAVIEREPLRLAITSSSVDKGRLTADQILEVDSAGLAVNASQ